MMLAARMFANSFASINNGFISKADFLLESLKSPSQNFVSFADLRA